MNYSEAYKSLISTRQLINHSGYTELHHIKPKSLGGGDEKNNLVKLTAREHFIAHKLLAKIHGGGMWAALAFMSRGCTKSAKGYKVKARDYELAKRKDAEYKSNLYEGKGNPFYGKTFTEEQLNKMRGKRPSITGINSPCYGKKREHYGWITGQIIKYKPHQIQLDLTLMNLIENVTGVTKAQGIIKLNAAYKRSNSLKIAHENIDKTGEKNPNYGNGAKISGDRNPMYGKKHSEATRAKIADKAARKINCPHCGRIGSISNMKRWHFDNCKKLK